MTPRRTTFPRPARPDGGYTLLEVLVSLAVLMAGVLAILFLLPTTMRAGADAGFLTEAALLAQMKAEEIRRDDDAFTSGTMVTAIAAMTDPTPPVPFPQNPRLSYSFSGQSLLHTTNDPADPRDDPNVARVIVRYSASYRSSQDVVYELRFSN